ncbi:hypothetical protein LINPERPRIM_LOCUS21620, partial [Linum perenne]
MNTLFYWPMMRSVYQFGAPCVDQQSKPGTSTKPYMLDSLWLMDFIQMHWSIVNQNPNMVGILFLVSIQNLIMYCDTISFI